MVVRADLVDTADPVFLIALTDITVPADRLRSLTRAGVSAFMFALDADGQYEPIAVAQLPGRSDFTLVDGYHRLEAVRRLGWASIKACIVGIGSDERRRREILSEVVRVKSDVFDRAAQIKALADMARADATLSHPVGPFDDVASTMIVLALKWDEQTAHTLGISRQTVYNHLKIARTFDADWISRLRKLGMAFDLVPLLALAKLEPRIITKAIGWLERRVDDDGRTTSTIVEAIAAVLGNAAPTAADKRFNAVIGNLGRMAEAERSAVVGRIVAQYLARRAWARDDDARAPVPRGLARGAERDRGQARRPHPRCLFRSCHMIRSLFAPIVAAILAAPALAATLPATPATFAATIASAKGGDTITLGAGDYGDIYVRGPRAYSPPLTIDARAAFFFGLRFDSASGLSPRVQAVIKQYGDDLDKAVAEALKVKGLEDLLANAANPFATTFRDLERQFAERLDQIVRIGELLYARRADLNDEGRDLAGALISYATSLAWHGLSEADRGNRITMALRRDLGETPPVGVTWPAEADDPDAQAQYHAAATPPAP